MANRYLQDNFAPVREEQTVTDLTVTGRLPRAPRRALPAHRAQPGRRPRRRATTGSSATAWCTASASPTARRSGTATATCAPTAVARQLGEPSPRDRTGTTRDFAANTHVHPARRADAGAGRGRLPAVRADRGARHRRPHRLRRDAARWGTLPAGYTAHPHEDPETGELHAVSYNWLRGNRVDYTVRGTDGRIRQHGADRGRRQPDDARLRADRELRRALRPARWSSTSRSAARGDAAGGASAGAADDVGDHRPQPAARPGDRADRRGARGSGRHRHAALLLGPGLPGAPRAAAPRGRPARTCAGSRSTRASCSTPSTPTRTATPSSSTWCATTGCSPRCSTVPTRGRPRWPGSPSTCSPTRCARTGSTTTPRSSRASTSGSPAGGTGSATRSASRTGRPGDAVLRHDLAAGSTVVRNLGAGSRGERVLLRRAATDATDEADGVLMGYVFDQASAARATW